MRLDNAPESDNVSDNRGMGGKIALGGGAGGILLVILGLIFGVDLGFDRRAGGPVGPGAPGAPADKETLTFTKKVLGTTEQVWADEFRKHRYGKYDPPHLELFSDRVSTGCGTAPSAVGPFYCPADRKVYIDPTFFNELENKLGGSKGDFSKAYVIAHEVGHHIQNLLGYSRRVDEARGGRNENGMSVRLELQADYLAGVWAHHGQRKFDFIEPGDVESAIKSANAIGDDRLQKRSGGFVHPEKFTHGTSAQRVRWFKDGLKTGDASKAKLDEFFEARSSKDL
ncbi:MAG: neutral zinc metallopeptidase [Gemmata sp.]